MAVASIVHRHVSITRAAPPKRQLKCNLLNVLVAASYSLSTEVELKIEKVLANTARANAVISIGLGKIPRFGKVVQAFISEARVGIQSAVAYWLATRLANIVGSMAGFMSTT
jgi:hypothetical protein